jgi:hypothetical protein
MTTSPHGTVDTFPPGMTECYWMSIGTRAERLLERRSLLLILAATIGLASAFLLRLKLEGAYYEYWVFPRDKAVDGYIYPQLRYTIFDVALLLWCFDGLLFSIMSVRSAFTSRSISGWPLRTLRIYFLLLGFLILDGTLMLVARRIAMLRS